MNLKRSTINKSVHTAKVVLAHFGVHLPAFAYWNERQWLEAGPAYNEIRECIIYSQKWSFEHAWISQTVCRKMAY